METDSAVSAADDANTRREPVLDPLAAMAKASRSSVKCAGEAINRSADRDDSKDKLPTTLRRAGPGMGDGDDVWVGVVVGSADADADGELDGDDVTDGVGVDVVVGVVEAEGEGVRDGEGVNDAVGDVDGEAEAVGEDVDGADADAVGLGVALGLGLGATTLREAAMLVTEAALAVAAEE